MANVGGYDRTLRYIAGVTFVTVGGVALLVNYLINDLGVGFAVGSIVAGIVFWVTAATRTCPCHVAAGTSTADSQNT